MIYFAFASKDPDELRATGIGHAGDFEYIEINGMLFGFVNESDYRSRGHIDGLHSKLKSLPGPAFGKLQDHHAKHISKAIPSVKKDDAMSAVLLHIYEKTGHEGFNPNHH